MDFREMPVLMKEQKENGKKDLYIEITKVLTDAGSSAKITTLGIDDTFVEQGTPAELYRLCGYEAQGILEAIKE